MLSRRRKSKDGKQEDRDEKRQRRREAEKQKRKNEIRKKGRRNYDYHPRGNGVYKLGCNVYGSNP